jgi:hypothetical protein
VHIAISLSAIGVSKEQANAWGADFEKDVVVSFELDSYDLSREHKPRVVGVVQSSAVDLNVLNLAAKEELGIGWLVKHRLESLFTPPLYPPKLSARPHLGWQQRARIDTQRYKEELLEVEEATMCSQSLALAALRQAKHEPNLAIIALLDEGARGALEATCVELTSDDVESFGVLAAYNFVARVTLFIKNTLAQCGGHCVMCWSPFAFPSLKPTCCDKKLCLFQYTGMGLGAAVLQEIRGSAEVHAHTDIDADKYIPIDIQTHVRTHMRTHTHTHTHTH